MRALVSVLLVVTAMAAGVLVADEPARPTIDDLGWISGHWRLEHVTATVEESWLGPSGGTMIGVNRTVVGNRAAGFEFLRLEERDGGIVLAASPGGRCPATEFVLIELREQRATFENPSHDFPQRIAYWLEDATLHTEVSGVDDSGDERKAGWVFDRVP